jgi:hypothetical protein
VCPEPLAWGLLAVGTHHQSILQHDILFNPQSQAKNAMINDTTVEPAAFAHDQVWNLRLMDLAW